MIRLLLSLTLLACALFAPAAHALEVGIADQKSHMWSDERFQSLGVKHARINVPWDVLRNAEGRDTLGAWLESAKAAGTAPLITFDRSTLRKSYNPSPGELAKQLKAIRARWPWANDFVTWNEPNLSKKPELVARWWRALRRACPSCRIVAGDLVDRANAISFARRFARAARRRPGIWGLHNYQDVNRFSTARTRRFLRATGRSQLWLTETGGVVKRANRSGVRFSGQGPTHQAKAMRFLFDRLAKVSKRIKRVYVYHWDGRTSTWDSALVGPDGRERPALGVLRRVLSRLGR
jgi:hypothetical protein